MSAHRKATKVIVIGAGMGGLAAAIDLARQGCDVTVLELASHVGGKMRQVVAGGHSIDAGPTVFTMNWVFESLFADARAALTDHLALEPAQILARHRWCDAAGAVTGLDLFADKIASAEAIRAFAGEAEAQGYLRFCARSADIYRTLRDSFIDAPRPSPVGLMAKVGLNRLDAMARTAPHRSLWSALGDDFKDPRLRQLFGRYATYCGASPFAAPATLMLIAHVEQDGVWRVKGGMVKVAQALEALARSLGVAFAFDTHVTEITCAKGRVTGIVNGDGQYLPADAIVFNGDVSALGQGLLGRAVASAAKPVPPPKRSQSALTWCVSARTSGMALAHHNVFFSNDYRAEFDDVFHARTLPVVPSIYVCAQDRGDAYQPTATESERLLVLINAPPDGDRHKMTQAEIDRAQKGAWDMMAACGLEIEATAEVSTAPHDFDAMFPGSGGALYGLANHGMWASFQRPGARSAIKGLYLAGGTTHPGPGIPMATLSGRRAAESIMQDYGD